MSRRGYSLVELLIVLAVLSALAALVQPTMRGVLDKSRLTGAAKQVQAALAKSRALAIREGVPVWFRFEPGGRTWWIEKAAAVQPAASPELGTEPAVPVPVPMPLESAGAETAAAVPAAIVLRSDRLPEGVTFPAAGSGLSERVPFSALGRTSSHRLRLHGQRQFVIDLAIRGLTGMASSTAPFRPAVTEPSAVAAATDSAVPEPVMQATERVLP
ncbi:MAG: prepilin-type N-terminal cleavage/methylation domain-containing protein [Planctomyces sp.]|nr:prepilin-type N-terminal cleavage/methylation domain-containing protein [Planctomyces sp.]